MSSTSNLSIGQQQQALLIQLLNQRDSNACWQAIIEYLNNILNHCDLANLNPGYC